MSLVSARVCAALIILCTAPVRSGTSIEIPGPDILVPADGMAGDGFGRAVAISGDTLAVSSPKHTHDLLLGSVYIYERTAAGWELAQELEPVDVSQSSGFASLLNGIALDGEHLLVSAWADDAVLAYRKIDGVWQFTQKISHTGWEGDWYGYSIALDGTTLAVGIPNDVFDGRNTGSVFFYEFENGLWRKKSEVFPPEPAANFGGSGFGTCVAVAGDVAVSMAKGYVITLVRSGSQWFWNGGLGTAEMELSGSVAISEGLTIAASSSEEVPGYGTGAVYVWDRQGSAWQLSAKLQPQNFTYWGEFGESFAIRDDLALVKVRGDIFQYSKGPDFWYLEQIIHAPSVASGRLFGYSTSTSQDAWAMGSQNTVGGEMGAAAVYDFAPLPIGIFEDGFEYGDTEGWSEAVGMAP